MLVILLILILLTGGLGYGGYHNGNPYLGHGSITLTTVLIIILLVMILSGRQ